MGKKSLYVLSIIAIIFLVFFVDFKSKNLGIDSVDAYTPGFVNYGPGLVNDFEGGAIAGTPPYPPFGPRNDVVEWVGKAPASIPTPVYYLRSQTGAPTNGNGISMMQIEWIGNSSGSQQYIELPSEKFENVGCTSPVYQTYEAKDWSCYDYLDLRFYFDGLINGGFPTAEGFQKVSLFDGQITFTSEAVIVPVRYPSEAYEEHISLSLNHLSNYYDVSAGRYFDISNIKSVIISAVGYDYTVLSGKVIMYYDYLSLSAKDFANIPPSTAGINVVMDGSMPRGVELDWNLTTPDVSKAAISAYHIYRATAAEGPYISVGYQSATNNAYTDRSLPYGDATFCYKILTCDNGPGTASGITDNNILLVHQKANTINGTYNEALLADAAEQCVYVPIIPSPTPSVTPVVSPTITPTVDPNQTPTPVVGDDIKEAHVYPNPFNPNAGTKSFKVDNVPADTKVQIFSMDGSLVYEGTTGTVGFTWSGRNKNGTLVVSGLYYLVLKDKKGKSDVKRIIVCYKCDPIDNE